ncbi:MAG: DMT family transporter [Gammaproteobacteria bacterium]|nr:DMT family transporter [Gammaproteobacteria bacterium]
MTNVKDSPPLSEYLLLLLLAALWGGSFTLIKVALEGFPPATIVTVRIALGGLILLVFASLRRDKFPKNGLRWLELFIQGVLQGALPFFLITWGEKFVDSSVAGIINSTPPMFVFLITVFVLHTAKFDMLKLVGIIFGMLGVALIAYSQVDGFTENNLWAVLAVLGASCSYACGAIFGKRFGDQSVFVTASVSLLLAALLVAPFAYFLEDPFSIEPALRPAAALAALTLFSTALASLIFFRLIKTLGPLATTSNAYLRALFSILFGVAFLSEPLSLSIVAATLFIFMGVFMVTGKFRDFIDSYIGKRGNK